MSVDVPAMDENEKKGEEYLGNVMSDFFFIYTYNILQSDITKIIYRKLKIKKEERKKKRNYRTPTRYYI